jgi:hypothetical protein
MNANVPKNHHFIPQHFLKAWCFSGKKLVRYKRRKKIGDIEVQKASIVSVASQPNLYRVEFPDGGFEIETSHVSPHVDAGGYTILEQARQQDVSWLSAAQRRALANYVVFLEARHPEVIKTMDVKSLLPELAAQAKREGLTSESVDHVIQYFDSAESLGEMAFGLFINNELSGLLAKPFADGLLQAELREYRFSSDILACSSYPVFRVGDYTKSSILLVLSITPCKALVYSSNHSLLNGLPENVRAAYFNLCALAKAEEVYFVDETMKDFVEKHLGWTKEKNEKETQVYLLDFINSLYS